MKMLDLFCGRLGVSKIFAKRGHECVCVDLIEPPNWGEMPHCCQFYPYDVLGISPAWIKTAGPFDFIWASSPCEEFSVWGMKHFHPNPPYPELGIKLFNHTRRICEESDVPYVMENVRAAQQFVGNAVHHCGPFYLWGTGVPPILHRGINKKGNFRAMPGNLRERILRANENMKEARNRYQWEQEQKALARHPRRHELTMTGGNRLWSHSEGRKEATALAALVPPELANCVAAYAERLLEQRQSA